MDPPPTGSLRQKAARGVLVMIVLNVFGTLLARVIQLVLPLYLLPQDFGIFAIAVFFSGFLALVSDLGLSTALIPRRDRFEEAANTAFMLQLLVALALILASLGIGWLAAQVYTEPRLRLPILVLSTSLIFQAISMVPRVVANRALQFGRAAIPDNVGKSSGALTTVAFAVLGFAYWSPVYGTVLGAAIGASIQLAWSKWRPKFSFNPALARELVRFGQFVMLAVFANFIAHSVDNIVVGFVLGVAPLGYYTVAYSWGVYLTSNLSSILSPVGYPLMAKVADAPARFKRAFLENVKYFSYVGMCLTSGILTFAPDFVLSFYGPTWRNAVLPMQILAPIGILLGYSAIMGDALYALGKSRTVFVATWMEVVALLIMLPPATIYLGLEGTSVAALLGGVLVTAIIGLASSRAVGFAFSDWRREAQDPLIAALVACGVGFGLTLLLPTSIAELALEVLIFIGVYVAMLQLLSRGRFLPDLMRILRLAVTRKKVEESPP